MKESEGNLRSQSLSDHDNLSQLTQTEETISALRFCENSGPARKFVLTDRRKLSDSFFTMTGVHVQTEKQKTE